MEEDIQAQSLNEFELQKIRIEFDAHTKLHDSYILETKELLKNIDSKLGVINKNTSNTENKILLLERDLENHLKNHDKLGENNWKIYLGLTALISIIINIISFGVQYLRFN